MQFNKQVSASDLKNSNSKSYS